MEFSIATLLSHFSDDKLIAGKVLEKKLGCEEDEESLEKLQIVLDALERVGILEKERGKYRRVVEENVVEAKLRCSSKGFCFAIQDVEDADDIYVRENQLGNAWNGDRVLVKVIKEGIRRRSPEGAVRLILERANPSLLAQVKLEDNQFRAVPLDDRLLFELNLLENDQDLANAIDHLVHVSVLRYPIGTNPPVGEVTKILGSDAEAAADTDIVCCKHDLPQSWKPEVLQAAENLPPTFDESELKNRQDLRGLLTFTFTDDIPRENLPFIETAFTLEKIEKRWQFGIHVTDVAHYVLPNSPLEKAAKKRGTSVYLGEKVSPLFPEAITQRCSLVPGEDRLALSFFVSLDVNAKIVGFEYHPSLIKVDHQLNFTQVQTLLSEPENVPNELEDLVEKLNQLFFTFSPLVKSQRLQRGSFNIQSDTQLPFLDEGRSGVVLVSEALPIRALLTELIVLMGKAIADHLVALQVPSIFCTQSAPDGEDLTDLLKLAANLKLEVTVDTEADLKPQDYANLTQAFVKSDSSHILNHLLEGTLKGEKYSTHPAPHFGLAYSNGYAHFISPGQRYADLLIQRVLKLVLSEGRDRRTKQNKIGVNLNNLDCHGQINWNVLPPAIHEALIEDFHLLMSPLNDRSKLAEDAEKDLAGLKKSEKMKERTGQIFRGLITGVQSYGFFVEIEDLLVEGLVHVSSLKDDWYEYRARHSCLVGRKNRTAYRLGNEVDVQIKSVDYYRQQIDLITVSSGVASQNTDWDEE